MSDIADPSRHQQLERQFIAHAERLVSDDRLRLVTARGRKSAVTLIRDVAFSDHGVELIRLMSEMGRRDRRLESQMPVGKAMDVALSVKKWWIFKSPVGRFRAICLSPARELLAGQPPRAVSASELMQAVSATPPPLAGIPVTLAIMSTSGFSAEAREAALQAQRPHGHPGFTQRSRRLGRRRPA